MGRFGKYLDNWNCINKRKPPRSVQGATLTVVAFYFVGLGMGEKHRRKSAEGWIEMQGYMLFQVRLGNYSEIGVVWFVRLNKLSGIKTVNRSMLYEM